MHATGVTPRENVELSAGVQVTDAAPELSNANGFRKALAACAKSTVINDGGHVMEGSSLSWCHNYCEDQYSAAKYVNIIVPSIVTVKLQEFTLPAPSPAEQVTE